MDKKVYEFISKKNNDPIIDRKTCPRTWEDFAIFQWDIDLLQKISPKIWEETFPFSYPKLDPTARMIRRMMLRNERWLYSTKSDISNNNIPTMYHPSTWIKSITAEEWETIDTVDYGQKYDFSLTFLEQFTELFYKVPKVWLITVNNENWKYDNFSSDNKNTFLNADIMYSENVSYSTTIKNVKNWYDLLQVNDSDLVYDCLCSRNLTKCINVRYSSNCYDSGFSVTCRNCSHCRFCDNLENKSNYVFNKPATQEKINKIKNMMKTYDWYQKLQNIFQTELWDKIIRPDSWVVNCENTIWSTIYNSQNAFMCFDSYDVQDCRYWLVSEYNTDCMDTTIFNRNSNWVYQAVCGWYLTKSHVCITWRESSYMYFCDFCLNCEYMIWCCGMKNKKYCILNKQYSKEERFELASKIIKQLQDEWLRWEFFPPEFSPFPYNDTVAMDYFPVKKVVDSSWKILQAENKEWFGIITVLDKNKSISDAILDLWWEEKIKIKRRTKDHDIKISSNLNIIKAQDLPEDINYVSDSICSKIILCSKTLRPYRITKLELDFYRKMQIALPRLHQDVRHKRRTLMRPPRVLYYRYSDKSGEETVSNYHKNVSFKVYTQKEYEKIMYW